ncbi:MAG: GNAT family N-acetyltransferase [Bdellovibrionia bacterium]
MDLQVEVVENPGEELVDFFEKRLKEFNDRHWEVKEKVPLVVTVRNEANEIVAGAAGRTFGNWLLLDNLWVSERLRGLDMGSKVLAQMETTAAQRGCKSVLLDTLNFQAKPFYEKHGYKVEWVMPKYPRDGHKYFMTKELPV